MVFSYAILPYFWDFARGFYIFSMQVAQRILCSQKVYILRIHYYLGWDLNQGRFFGFVLQAQYRLEEVLPKKPEGSCTGSYKRKGKILCMS